MGAVIFTKMPAGDSSPAQPFKFHQVHGKNIVLSEGNTVAKIILRYTTFFSLSAPYSERDTLVL